MEERQNAAIPTDLGTADIGKLLKKYAFPAISAIAMSSSKESISTIGFEMIF